MLTKVIQKTMAQNRAAFLTGFTSYHSGESVGFSWNACPCCKDFCGGNRYELRGLKPSERGGMESEYLGDICESCMEYVND